MALFIEASEHYIWCFTRPEADGTFTASVTFERRADHRNGLTLIPAMRHVVPGAFASEKAATDAAIEYADRLGNYQTEDIGL